MLKAHLKGNILHRLNRRPIQVVVVLAGFNKQVSLNVSLHLLDARHEVIISPVHLILSLRSGGVGDAGTKPLRELSHQVVIDPVLQGSEDDDRSGELKINLLNRLIC